MTKRLCAKHKIDRRLGVNLWGTAKSPFLKRNYGPGQHGMQRSKLSDYGLQLRAKQKLKVYYGEMTEKQFRASYKEAFKRRGDTSENLIALLESRLQTVVYRASMASTIFAARQMVSHGKILVNGKRVNIASYKVKPGDVVTKTASPNDNLENKHEYSLPDYYEASGHRNEVIIKRLPLKAEVPFPVQMEPHLVVEFYSR